MRIAHTADIHIRGTDRHDEYKHVLEYFVKDCKEKKVDVAFLGGDIFHTKTNISPEYVDFLTQFLTNLSTVCQVRIILGNHDGNLVNLKRQDAVTPIVNALNLKNVYLHKFSGVYPLASGFNLCVFSIYDEENWKNIRPDLHEVNIAAYHGGVVGSTTNSWIVESDITPETFENYDLCLLGDIHKFQYLGYRNGKPWIAYPGTPVQQNYDESVDHSYLIWDIKNKGDWSVEVCELPNLHPFVTVDINDETRLDANFKNIKLGSRIRVRHDVPLTRKCIEEIKVICGKLRPKEIVFQSTVKRANDVISAGGVEIKKNDLSQPSVVCNLISEFHQVAGRKIDESEIVRIKEKIEKYSQKRSEVVTSCRKWKLQKMQWDNTFSYAKGNDINFDRLDGVVGLIGPNKSGKSSIVGTLLYGLFNSSDRGSLKNLYICNKDAAYCSASVCIEADNVQYVIDRITSKKSDKRGNVSATTNLNFYKYVEGELIDLCKEGRTDTEKEIQKLIGNSDDFLLTSVASQSDGNNFINEGSSKRKQVISRHFGLDIIQHYFEQASKELNQKKIELKSAEESLSNFGDFSSDQDIDRLQDMISKTRVKCDITKEEIRQINQEINSKESSIDVQRFEDLVKKRRIVEREVANLEKEIHSLVEKISQIESKKNETETVISALGSLDHYIVLLNEIDCITKSVFDATQKEKDQKLHLALAQKGKKVLEGVPCQGMQDFQHCEFIRDAVENASNIEIYERDANNAIQKLNKLKGDLLAKGDVSKIRNEQKQLSTSMSKLSTLKSDAVQLESQLQSSRKSFSEKSESLKLIETSLKSFDENTIEIILQEIQVMKERVRLLIKKESELSNLIITIAKEIGKKQSDNDFILAFKKSREEILTDIVTLDYIVSALNKKAIPVKILNSQLPNLNDMIEDLLRGIVDFKLTLAHDDDSDQLEVYVDYDGTPVLIEQCSGMEKTLSSIAIRVALSQITQLPQTNFLIIDEGFGTLDSSSIEACNRFIKSLASIYDFVCIISHIDSVKDAADTYIEIQKNGKYSVVNK